MSGKTWEDALSELSTTQEERDAQMLKKIADIGEALDTRGTAWDQLSNEQAAAILGENGITPDDFTRLVQEHGSDENVEGEEQKAEGEEPAAEAAPAAEPTAEPVAEPTAEPAVEGAPEGETIEFSDEAKADFKEKAQQMSPEEWNSFIDELTDAQAENVMALLDADPEKVASWIEQEEASYYGTMRAFSDIQKIAEAEATPSPEESAMSEINAVLDNVFGGDDK